MNKGLLRNTFAKTMAAVMLAVILTTAVFSAGTALVLSHYEAYSKSFSRVMSNMLAVDAYDEASNFWAENGGSISEFDKKNAAEPENADFIVKDKTGKVIYNSVSKKEKYISESTLYSYVSDDDKNNAEVTAYLTSSYVSDTMKSLMQTIYSARYRVVIYSAVLFIIGIMLAAVLLINAGKRKEDDDIHLRRMDRIPSDLYLLLAGGTVTGLVAIGVDAVMSDIISGTLIAYLLGILCMIIVTAFMMCMAVQFKKGIILRGSIIGRICIASAKGIRALPYVWKTVAAALIIAVLNFVVIGMNIYGGGAAILILEVIAAFIAVWYMSVMIGRLKKGGEAIASGNTAVEVNTKGMSSEMRKHAENLNSINLAIVRAVDERMKSEMFKTELITNVSHDIKTPLTSIINYTDLLRSEQLNNETASEYVEIIAKHAAKLKKLTVDIVDASKASTGNVKVDISKLSVGMMLEQAVGEYREKLEKSHLVPVISIPDNDIEIMADGRHMGRVLDNVLSNICKYAQPETRVYMDVKEDGNKAVIVFKNISGAELNISADDLMERFVRGDASRNTEGSGLGLSIAKSLTQLQGGTFDIAIDGDLFKVVITMNMAMDMSGE